MRNSRLDNVVCFIGRKNSGKTTLVEQVIVELTRHDLVVSSLKHHSHNDFEIDIPGKDSYRHHAAGTESTAIVSDTRLAMIEELDQPHHSIRSQTWQCYRAIGMLPASNVVVVEGFKQAGIPSVELFRADNPRDVEAAPSFIERLREWSEHGASECVGPDFDPSTLRHPIQSSFPAAVVTDIPAVAQAAEIYGLPCFGFTDIAKIATWVVETFEKPLLSVVIQCGGESKRMGQPKELALFHERPLIEHMIGRLYPLAADLVITTNQPENLSYLQAYYPELRLVRDKLDVRGALPGFITALDAALYENVAVVACDLVNVSPTLIDYETMLLCGAQDGEDTTNERVDAVVPVTKQGFEPFCGVYKKESCLGAAMRAWESGEARMRDVLETITVCELDAKACPYCPPGCFMNVNTPEELIAAEKLD